LSPETPAVLYVSKPLSPPWNDSGKNLVRDLAENAPRHAIEIFAGPGFEPASPRVRVRRRAGKSAYAPGLGQKAALFGAILALPSRIRLLHFFFAPNPPTSRMARLALSLNRRPAVQTISSSPERYEGIAGLCFGRRVVALSEYNRRRLEEAGVRGVVKIHPGLDLDRARENPEGAARWREKLGAAGRRVVLYAGDYEFSAGGRIALDVIRRLVERAPEAMLVFACRRKTPAAGPAEARIKSDAALWGIGRSVRFLNEVDDMAGLLTLADVSLMPVETLYAKMDMPLVLLEHMALGKPVVVSDVEPLVETIQGEGGIAVPHGDVARLVDVIAELFRDERAMRERGAAARRAVETHFDIRKSAEAYAALYDEILKDGR
jgi:phosphatidylinositol alpha-1,6-mannosyltransferase